MKFYEIIEHPSPSTTSPKTPNKQTKHYKPFTRVHLSALRLIQNLITLHNYINISVVRF